MNESNKKEGLRELFTNSYVGPFISWFSFFTFVLSNLIIFFIFASFFELNIEKSVLFFLIGIIISSLLLKTGYFIKTFEKKNISDKKSFIKNIKTGKEYFTLGWWTSILIFARLLFFNILNELFIVLIFWSFFFGVAFVSGFVTIAEDNFQNLVNILTVLGILSGLFQFYITYYKEEISKKIVNGIAQYFVKISKKISFHDFLEYVKKKDKTFHSNIENEIHQSPTYALLKSFRASRAGNNVMNITLNVGAQNDAMLAEALEFSQIDKTKLSQHYDSFFKEKDKELKKYIEQMNITELKRTLLPNIIFFEEVTANLTKSNYDMDLDSDREPETYQERANKLLSDNIFYLIGRILNMKIEEHENKTDTK